MILCTPMFPAIHHLDPEAQIDIIGHNRNGCLDVVKGNPHIGGTYDYSFVRSRRHRKEVAAFIAKQKYDAALIPMGGAPGWLQLLLFRSKIKTIKKIVSIPGNQLWERASLFFLYRRIHFIPWLTGRHEIDLNLDLVQSFSRKPLHRSYRTSISYSSDENILKELGLPPRYVCLQIGAAAGLPTPKKWQEDRFSLLINFLSEQYPQLGLVAVGTQKEYEMFAAPLMQKHPQLINTAGRTDINQLCNILAGAQATVTHDSGIMHMANALGAPLIALYGPTDYTRTSPLGPASVVLRKELDCAPCMFGMGGRSEAQIYEQCPRPACMEAITVDDVLLELQKVLKV